VTPSAGHAHYGYTNTYYGWSHLLWLVTLTMAGHTYYG
jgi:hypothetical protein